MKHLVLYMFTLLVAALPTSFVPAAHAQTPFIGEIRLVGFTFCPRNWVEADGQLISIVSNEALFSLYGTTYGGDGQTTFALPDLRGRAPIHLGQGPGLSNYVQGQTGGTETVTLSGDEMPIHAHTFPELTNPDGTVRGLVVRNGGGEQATPTSDAGGGAAHENRPPYLTMRYCVALFGTYPSRN